MPNQINAQTAQQIVNTVKDICESDINYINEQGLILASTDDTRINTFHEIGKLVITTGKTIEVREDDKYYGTFAGVNIPVNHHNRIVAAIGISGDPEVVRKYAYLALRITTLILKELDLNIQSYNQRNRVSYVVHSLITNNLAQPEYVTKILTEYQLNRSDYFCTILIRFDAAANSNYDHELEAIIFRAFEASGSVLYTFNYPNEYVLLISRSLCKKRWYLFEKLATECGNRIKIAQGSFHPLEQQSLSYRAAVLTIKSMPKNQSLASYYDLNFELILGSVSEATKKSYFQKTIDMLSEEDCVLLNTYFEEEQSLLKTSQKLSMHKNTLQYRLDKIYKLSGYNPRVFKDAVVLYSALRMKLHS